MTKSVDEEGRVTTYEIDANNGDIKSITQVGNSTTPSSTTRFTYENNTHGLVSTIVDADGNISANNYDDKGRLIGVKQGNTIVSTLTYDPLSGNILTKTDGNNKKTSYEYQTDTNRIKTATYADSLGKTEYVYDKKGLLTSAINSDGYGQTLEYDELNRVKSTTQLTAKGAIIQKMDYDKAGNVSHITNGDNQQITNIYDARNRLIEVDNIDGSKTTYKYDALNNLTKLVDAVGNETEFKYETVANDSRTRLTETRKQIESGNYLATKATYNNALQIKELTDGVGKKTKYEYDNLGRQIQVTQELDNPLAESGAMEIINKTTYFDNGNIKTITDGNNHTTTYTYDGRNLKSTSTDELGTKTTYGYDGAGNLTSINTANPTIQGTASITYKYDTLNRRTQIIDALNGTTTTSYDLSGNVTRVEDANHHATQYQYQAAERTLTSTDALGHKTVTLYDKLGRIAQLTQKGDSSSNNPERVTNYEYDNIYNTSTVKRPEGITEVTQLDSIGNIKSITTTVNGDKRTTAYKYNGLNKLTLIEDTLGNTSRYEYDNLGNLTTTTQTDNQLGGIHITQSQSNNLGWKIASIDAKGQVYTTTYDAVGNVIKQTENGLRTTTNTYDVLNRNIQVTTKTATETLDIYTNYDAVGNILSQTDAQNNTTNYQYDSLNRRSKTIDAKFQDTDYIYDAVGNLKEIIDTPTRKTIYTYDALNRRSDIKDAENIVTHTEYNPFGEIKSIAENATGINPRTTQYEYDKLGRKVKTIDSLNHTTITEYDEASNIRSIIDANNNKTSYEYDRLNRQTKVIDANGITSQLSAYDGFGNVKSIKDAGGNETKYEYDELDRLTKTTDPRKKQTIQDYDGLGRVKSVLDRNTQTKTFAYNINDNLLAETWDDGTVISYTYDKVGNLKTSRDGKSGVDNSYDYDAIYQLTSAATSNSSVKFKYNYDEFGDKLQRQDIIGGSTIATLGYTYNNNHQLTNLTQSGTGVITQDVGFSYDKLSQLTQVDRKSASNLGHLITDYAYDSVGRLVDINNRFNTTNISHYGYGYDDGNRLTGKSGNDGISTVNYGKDNQISAVDNSTRPDEAYNFNALGIRAGWVTDALDSRRVLNDGKYQYQYDDEGNLTQKKELVTGNLTNYSWDYRNRLTKVTSGSQVVEYLYDAEDKRVGKKVGGVVTEKYIYDGSDIALVVNGAGVLVERYLFGDGVDNVLSREKGGAVVWSLGDRQGSVVDLVDGNGAVLNHFVYDSFGGRSGTTGVDFRFGYTGRELDTETGLYYYRARYYDPTMGRFISEDPMGFGGGDTNLYRYVNNSPTNYTDPTGEIANAIAGAGFGALFGGLYAVANDIETGNFGWNTFGNVAMGAAGGAVAGAAAATGVGILSGFATAMFGTSVAGAIVNTSFAAGATAYGAYNAGGNFGQGRYLTGALDLVGVGLGAKNVFSGVTRDIPQMYWAEVVARRANLAAMYPPDPNPPGYQRPIYQVGDPQLNSSGAILRAQSSALATTPNWGQGGGNNGGRIIAGNAAGVIAQSTQCFVAGTEIQTIDGEKNIEDIQVGDWVLSDDPNTVGEIEYKQVLNTFVKDTTNLVDIYIDGEKITTTEEHPFWVPNVGWVAAKDLHAGTLLQTKYESCLDVDKVEKRGGLTTVYNFEVEGFHTYFVSDLGLLVHNTCKIVLASSVNDVILPQNPIWPSNPTIIQSPIVLGSYEIHHANFGGFNGATPAEIRAARAIHIANGGTQQNFIIPTGKRQNGGGHGQDSIDNLNRQGIPFNILHTFENGVRTGNIPNHVDPNKTSGVNQTWFPNNWGSTEIADAGRYVADFHGSIHSYPNSTKMFANYNGVRVGIIIDNRATNRVGTIVADVTYQPVSNYSKLVEKNPYK